ncbi:MAG: M48 family metalloprotease [Acidobacteriota bacterium]
MTALSPAPRPPRMHRTMRPARRTSPRTAWIVLALALVLLAGLIVGCSANPVTGKQQINFYSEAQEIALGKQADRDMVAQLGLVDDEELTRYVQALGLSMAENSERPSLPWTFRVIDDPMVNAFALPGGYVYITRGLLSYLGSEAELAGVLGHEIGHVTARHSVNRLSKAQLAQTGLLVATVAVAVSADDSRDRAYAGLGLLAANVGTQLAFLKFSRDDERQADALGFRYMRAIGQPPEALSQVFDTLQEVSLATRGGTGPPPWLSTHPELGNRRVANETRFADAGLAPSDDWGFTPYRQQIDGLVFGVNPRQGFVADGRFIHPDLGFQFDVPDGWRVQNERARVIVANDEGNAGLILTLAEADDPRAALNAFGAQESVTLGDDRWLRSRRLTSRLVRIKGDQSQGALPGGVAFVEHSGQIIQMLGIGTNEGLWKRHDPTLERAVASFGRLREARLRNIQPQRIEVIPLRRAQSLRAFNSARPSSVELDVLARVNQVEPDAVLPAGTLIKRIVGDGVPDA